MRRILALFCLVGICAGQMPAIGDYIEVRQSVGVIERVSRGTLLDVDGTLGLITVQLDEVYERTGFLDFRRTDYNNSTEMVYSISTIIAMREGSPLNS